MPKVPAKWIADSMMSVFTRHVRHCTVSEIANIGHSLKKIRFQSNAWKGLEWWPSREIEFRVTDTEFRHYTVSDWDADGGYAEILVYLHLKGPGSKWLDNLRAGDSVTILGPGGRFLLDLSAAEYMFLGDESTIGLFSAFQQCLLAHAHYSGAIECGEQDMQLPESVGLQLDTVKRNKYDRGKSLLKWVADQPLNPSGCLFYIAGHAETNKMIRKKLLSLGVKPSNIKVNAYWADDKAGL